MVLKVLIADDEEHIRMELQYILKQIPELEIISMCTSGDEALDAIMEKSPDIVFLDINMPMLNGIKLGYYLKKVKEPPYIIYITAHEEHAVDAFKVGARAYILKPFADSEIMEQVYTAKTYMEERKLLKRYDRHKNSNNTPVIVSGEVDGRIYPVDEKDIKLVYTEDRKVHLLTDNHDLLTHYTLTQLEMKLSSNMFFRCHRQYLVNLYKIKEIHPWFKGTYILIIDHPERIEVPVSRGAVKEFKKRAGIS